MTHIHNSRSASSGKRSARGPVTAPRKSPQQARSQATVQAILDATARILVRTGYDHASTNKVAEAAGVSVGSLYQYFPSKEALVAALVNRHHEEMMLAFSQRMARAAELPLEDAIALHVRGMVDAHLVDPSLHRVLAEQVPRVGKLAQQMDDINQRASGPVRAYLELRRACLRPELDLDIATFVLVNMVEALTHRTVLLSEAPPREPLIQAIIEVVVRYLTESKTGPGMVR
jgi:AcrR family transcriptional regulator